jgi:hypothetical protein
MTALFHSGGNQIYIKKRDASADFYQQSSLREYPKIGSEKGPTQKRGTGRTNPQFIVDPYLIGSQMLYGVARQGEASQMPGHALEIARLYPALD